MKVRAIVVTALAACAIGTTVWLTEANALSPEAKAFTEALQKQDTPRLIRSLIERMKGEMEKDDDSLPELIRQVEDYTRSCPDTASAALLRSMTAEMYRTYYDRNGWKISQRTDLAGYRPDDLREWTSNLFLDKIREEIQASLRPDSLLQKTPVGQFAALLTPGRDNRLRPTLYDLLLARAVELQPDSAYYARWEEFRRAEKGQNPEAWLHVRLAQTAYLWQTNGLDREAYEAGLEELLADPAIAPYANQVRVAQITLWEQTKWQQPEAARDSLTARILATCREGIRRHPDDSAAITLANTAARLQQSTLHIDFPNQLYPGKPLRIDAHYRNAQTLAVRIFKSLRRPEDAWKNMYGQAKALRGAEVKSYRLRTQAANSYTEYDSTYTLAADLPLGLYECEVSIDGKGITSSYCFSVSRLAILYRDLPEGRREAFVTDAESGKPLPGVAVRYYRASRTDGLPVLAGKAVTGREGWTEIPRYRDMQCLRPLLGKDTSAVWTPTYFYNTFAKPEKAATELSLFTDRGIYRPGQTVFVKGIAYIPDTDQPHTAEGQTVELSLRDANRQEIARKSFTTDAFGAFDGEFVLPKGGLNGTYLLQSNLRGSCRFRVEEYKRPSFQLSIDTLKEEATFGEKLQLRGRAATFSGTALTGGEVAWRIVRRPFWLRSYMPKPDGYTTRQEAEGRTTVDGSGRFAIPFTPPVPDEAANPVLRNRPQAACYELIATLTDSKGETQEAHYTFAAANVGLVLQVEAAERMETSEARVEFSAQTINRVPVDTTGEYTLYALSDREKPDAGNDPDDRYAIADTVRRGRFDTRKPLDNTVFQSLPSGRYQLAARVKDSRGRETTARETFILYRHADKRPPVFAPTWLLKERTECLPGEEAAFTFGTSYAATYIYYELCGEMGNPIHREWIRLDNENRTFRIPFLESYGNGVTALFTLVREGQVWDEGVEIRRRQPDRRLRIVPETFRDYLLPGAREQWKFKVLDADSANVTAQLLAGMYDASLDAIDPFRWSFAPERNAALLRPRFREGSSFNSRSDYAAEALTLRQEPRPEFSDVAWQGLLDEGIVIRGYGKSMKRALVGSNRSSEPVLESLTITDDAATLSEPQVFNAIAEEEIQQSARLESGTTGEDAPLQIRRNLQETAFFFPALTTDGQGETAFSFTMPESNTTWKLQLLAHTEELKYGQLTREVVTNKPLMVAPNLPRFLREGDEVALSAQVINHSGTPQAGMARLEFFNPENDRTIGTMQFQAIPFTVEADSTATVSWQVRVPQGTGLVGCRISAGNASGSDGEQHLLPVLTNQLLVTESIPFYLRGMESERIRLKQPKGSRPFRYTLEVSANPVWYAVQALPTLADPAEGDILSWFASYYSNTLAAHIARSNPRIRSIVEQWTADGGNASTLLSALEKNEELKNVLLAETPWVLEAKEESEQKQRLALLFDLNRAEAQRNTALQRLLAEQNADGGWSWFKGFPASSRPVTQAILKGMAQLTELNAIQYGEAEKEMQMRALRYLDRSIQKDYEERQRLNLGTDPDAGQIDYLFLRSAYRDIPELGSAREAIRAFTDGAARTWKQQSLYSRAQTALLMHRNGDKATAAEILAWLRKTASTDREKGMFWKNNRPGTSYFHAPVEVQAMLMDAFRTIDPDAEETDRMKQWLLGEKRTQRWASVPATLNALHALLLTGSDWLDEENQCVATWGNRSYATAEGETATGYIRTVLAEKEITPADGELTIRKTEGLAPAWGAVYNQYYQPIDRVEQQKGRLYVEKKLFVEASNGSGRVLQAVEEGTPLRVGQKVIVRLVVRSDRSMDFVSLKDLRAGCFEPARQLSGCTAEDGVWFYRSPKDASENFFFDHLPAGTFVIEYPVYVSRRGDFAGGISTIQCLYAPEFTAHSEGKRLKVE